MQYIISAPHYDWRDVAHGLERAQREFGLDGVELSWHYEFVPPHCSRQNLGVLARAKGTHGLLLVAHIWENLAELGPGPAEPALYRWLDLCPQTGVTGLVIHGGSYPDRHEGIRRTRAILERVLPRFERAGVTLYLENHYAFDHHACHELFSEPWEFLEVLPLNSPSLAFCFDTGHGHMTRNWDALITRLAPWLRHVHLADNHGAEDDHLMFRRGTVPWDAMFDRLAAVGFDGTFCVEFPVREDPAPFRACVRELRRRWPDTRYCAPSM